MQKNTTNDTLNRTRKSSHYTSEIHLKLAINSRSEVTLEEEEVRATPTHVTMVHHLIGLTIANYPTTHVTVREGTVKEIASIKRWSFNLNLSHLIASRRFNRSSSPTDNNLIR